ncbi:hypothetical protein GCM10027601_13000 [Nocardioides ungokensis]
MARRKPASAVRHRGRRAPLGARLSASVGRGAVVAVVGGVALVILTVLVALTSPSDPDSRSRWADGRSAQGTSERRSPSAPVPHRSVTAPKDVADAAATTSVPSDQPSAAGATGAPPATSSPAPSASPGKRPKHHGKPPWSTSHPKPAPGGHGSGGRH